MNTLIVYPKKQMLTSIAPFEIRPLGKLAPGASQSFTILWIIRGKAQCRIDMNELTLSDNELVCIKPGKVARLETSGGPEGYMISFTDNFLNMEERELDLNYQKNLFWLFSHSPLIAMQYELREEMRGIAERMRKEFENIYLYKNQILLRYLKIFLLYLSRHGRETVEELIHSRGTELAGEFISLLDKNFKNVRSVSSYAKQLSVTANHLNVVVKQSTGHTAGHHVKQRLILEAKRLAIYSNLCMKEIADDLGFSDPAHFSKFFKNCSGMNFSDFKRNNIRFACKEVKRG